MSLKEIKQRFRKFTGIYKKNFLQLSQNQILSPLLKVFFVCKDEDAKVIHKKKRFASLRLSVLYDNRTFRRRFIITKNIGIIYQFAPKFQL
jgi:hypothetical protein